MKSQTEKTLKDKTDHIPPKTDKNDSTNPITDSNDNITPLTNMEGNNFRDHAWNT